jgi:glycosyltransferase involved in cell wall biosynthesis
MTGANVKMQEFIRLMTDLKGGVSLDEASLLRRLASETDSGCIVEIGSFRGKSAVALAIGVRDRSEGDRPAIYCVEPHRPFTGFYGGCFGPQDRGVFFEVMLKTGCYQEVALINLPSDMVVPGWRDPIGLLFIDGDHHYDAVKQDFELWESHLVSNGLLVLDDSKDPACGPFQLQQEIMSSGRYILEDSVGKISVLRKTAADPKSLGTAHRKRLLIACHDLVLAGGLLRFERVGEVWRRQGHDVAFLTLTGTPAQQWTSQMPVLTLEQAHRSKWDAVIVPGAGFPETTIQRFAELRDQQFGTRIQHILNDQSKRDGFKRVNTLFEPHVVIFNNTHWPVGTFTEFKAEQFHILPGAVDTERFRALPERRYPLTDEKWVIGGQARKNPEPLIEALRRLPSTVTLRLFGPDSHHLAKEHADLVKTGRLELLGPLLGDELCRFYQTVDLVVMTETQAGWSNLAAEAMASGVPVVCTPHGTETFAKHKHTALVTTRPTADAIVEAVSLLMKEKDLAIQLAVNARQAILAFDWETYGHRLLACGERDGMAHYYYAPEQGLFGKWPVENRLLGLEDLLSNAHGKTILDLGSAEGMISQAFLQAGASLVHGYELDPRRVELAAKVCADWPEAEFHVADLGNWSAFRQTTTDGLRGQYHIVLYLGVHHHLPPASRMEVLRGVASLAERYLAVRMTEAVFKSDQLDSELGKVGFRFVSEHPTEAGMGPCKIYERQH